MTASTTSASVEPRPVPRRHRDTGGLWRSLRGNPGGIVGLAITSLFVLTALFGPYLISGNPTSQDLSNALLHPGSPGHLLGTDEFGRDILLQVVYGARASLELAATVVAVEIVVGIGFAVLAVECGGIVDNILLRLADIQLAIPFILLAIALLTVLQSSFFTVAFILVLAGWVRITRVLRTELRGLRDLDSIVAARSLGASRSRIIVRHMLPNVSGLILVLATLDFGNVILLASALSFLGLTVGMLDWGTMLANGQTYLTSAWWIATMPGIALTIVILGANLLGDWLRDVFDPRSNSLGMGRLRSQD